MHQADLGWGWGSAGEEGGRCVPTPCPLALPLRSGWLGKEWVKSGWLELQEAKSPTGSAFPMYWADLAGGVRSHLAGGERGYALAPPVGVGGWDAPTGELITPPGRQLRMGWNLCLQAKIREN